MIAQSRGGLSFGAISSISVNGKGAEKMVACNQTGEIIMFELSKRL